MSASIDSPKNAVSHMLFGLQFSSFGWNAALAHAEKLALSKDKPATIAFVDEGKIFSRLFGFGRDMPGRHLLLPADSVFLRLLLKFVWRKQPVGARFSPASFISALLTYFAEPCRIGLLGDNKGRLESLCRHFARHAPWHEFVAIAPDANLCGRLDLLIVDAAVADQRIEDRLDGADIGLVIMAGRGLSRLVRPHAVSTGAQPSVSKPSLA